MLLPVVAALLLPLGCSKPQSQAEEESHPAPVKVAEVQRLSLPEWTELVGTTQPLPHRAARISAPVDGRLVSVFRDASGQPLVEGQEVEAGTVVAQLDTRILIEQRRQAEFATRLAEIEVKRLEALNPGGAANGQMPLVSRIDLQKARIALEDAQSKLKALDEQLKLYTLTAPIRGRLGLVQVVPGQTLAAGATVADVVDLSEVDVLCFLPPHRAAHLQLDQPARMGLANGLALDGKVVFIAVQAQAENGNFAAKVRFPNPAPQTLRANTIHHIQVQTQAPKERFMIPAVALMEDQTPPEVVVVTDLTVKSKDGKKEKRGKARRLRAVTGMRDPARNLVEIIRLEDAKHEEVPLDKALFVIDGAHGLHDDDKVQIEEEHGD